MKMTRVFPVFSFAAFVLWLLAVAMDGPLLHAAGISAGAFYFLPPHILALLLIGLFCPPRLFGRLAPACVLLTALLTIALPFLTSDTAAHGVLMLMGVCGAFTAILACRALKQSRAPLAAAAGGLVLANFAVFPFFLWPGADLLRFATVAALLLIAPATARRLPEIDSGIASDPVSRWHYLPFIVLFQIVSGLMYGFIMPAYQPAAYVSGAELAFYILAVAAAFRLVRKNLDLALVCGVVLGMGAFTLLEIQVHAATVNLGMFAMQGAAGFIDVALLALLLGFPDPVRAFGIGLASVCAGILGGKILVQSFADVAEPVVLAGHLVLNLSILTLYFLGRFYYSRPAAAAVPAAEALPVETAAAAPPAQSPATDVPAPNTDPDQDESRLPDNLRLLLSEREHLVLTETLAGRNFRETARELGISESTVKTYMRRIYEKMGVKGKKELFTMLSRIQK